MKRTILIIVIIMLLQSVSFTKVKSVSFFSLKSLYVYLESGTIGINPYEPYEYGGKDWEHSMIYGAGFTLLNLHNRYKLNFEFDFAKPDYSVYYENEFFKQDISFYNYKLNFEYMLRRGKISFFAGIGVSHIRYLESTLFYEDSYTVMLVETGIKFALSKKLYLRGEFKYFADPEDDIFDDYYYDDSHPIGGSLAVGLELKF